MIHALTAIKKKQTTNSSLRGKKLNKQNELQNHYTSFKSMIFMQEANDLLAAKWQKLEVYPFCD